MKAPDVLHELLDMLYAQVDQGETPGMISLATIDMEADQAVNRTVLCFGPHRGQVQTIISPVAAGESLLGAIQPHVVDATAPDLPPD